jgi:Cu/Ag efflux protein CusF
MRLWRSILLVNLALSMGVILGYARWGREAARLRTELARTPAAITAAPGSGRSWTARGIVRWIEPTPATVVISHEAIPGLMDSMTMAFEVANPRLLDGLGAGDRVRFTLEVEGRRLRLIQIAREPT